jgi:hypothetical protein
MGVLGEPKSAQYPHLHLQHVTSYTYTKRENAGCVPALSQRKRSGKYQIDNVTGVIVRRSLLSLPVAVRRVSVFKWAISTPLGTGLTR